MDDMVKISYDNLYDFNGYDVYETKFNNMSYFQYNKYDSKTYNADDKVIIKNENGNDEVKNIPLNSYIRWKYNGEDTHSKEKDLDNLIGLINNKKIQSNAKIVEWSDGTYQLIIGDDYYDIKFSDLKNIRFGLSSDNNENIFVNKPIDGRMILTPCDYQGEKSKLAEDSTKVKLAYNYYNPNEYKKEEYGANKYNRNKFKDFFEKETKRRKKSEN